MILKRPPAIAFAVAIFFITILLAAPAALAAGKCDAGHQSPVAAPKNLKVSSLSDTQASLKWSAPKNARGVGGYNIYRGGLLVGTTAGTSFTDTGLLPNTYYTWTVKAVDAWKRHSPASKSVTAATPIIIRDAEEWTQDNAPASVNGGLIVEEAGSLKIDAGVRVLMKPGVSVLVSGSVNAAGTSDSPVVFTSVKDKAFGGRGVRSFSDYWNTISVACGGTFTGENVKIFYGSTLASVKGVLTLTNTEAGFARKTGIFVDEGGEFYGTDMNIHDFKAGSNRGVDVKGIVYLAVSQIRDCPGAGVFIEASGTFNGTSVNICDCGRGVYVRGGLYLMLSTVSGCDYGLYFSTTSAGGVMQNSFLGNEYGVYNARPDDVTIDASMNWWGSPDGPSVYDPALQTWSQAGDRVSTGVIYDNWLTEPAQ